MLTLNWLTWKNALTAHYSNWFQHFFLSILKSSCASQTWFQIFFQNWVFIANSMCIKSRGKSAATSALMANVEHEIRIANASVDHRKKAIYIKVSISNIKIGDKHWWTSTKLRIEKFCVQAEERSENQLANICIESRNFLWFSFG